MKAGLTTDRLYRLEAGRQKARFFPALNLDGRMRAQNVRHTMAAAIGVNWPTHVRACVLFC